MAVALVQPQDSSSPSSTRWRQTVDSAVTALLATTNTAGAIVAMVANGKVELSAGYGLADLRTRTAMTDSSLLNVASVSKPVATWGILRLVEQGRIGLDDAVAPRIRRWTIPQSAFSTSGVTVRRALSHTAGLSVAAVPAFPADSSIPSLEAVLRGDAGDKGAVSITSAPGGAWSYSGGGFTVLELMAEEVSGARFDDFMRQEVFQPLGMTRTSFSPWERRLVPATLHNMHGGPVPAYRYIGGAAGGLYTCARDMARFLLGYQAVHTGRDPTLPLTATTLAKIATPAASVVLNGQTIPGALYGLGHGVSFGGAANDTLYYHSGGNPGTRAYMIVVPKRGLGLFVATNSDNGEALVIELRRLWGERYRVALPPMF